jgi:carbamoyl-phosphate synthase large subunit
MNRVLFTGGGGAGNEAIFRLFSDLYETHFADAEESAFAGVIPRDRRHVIPFPSSAKFVAELASLCRTQNIDLIVPGVDEELEKIPDVVESCAGLAAIMPQKEFVLAMLDKLTMVQTLARHGLATPRTVTFDRAEEIGFPCIVKPRRGRGSRGVMTIEDANQAGAYLTLMGGDAADYIAQELLSGQEYTVLVAADRGGALGAVVPMKVLSKKGITIRAETESEIKVIDYCSALHRALPAGGLYNVQLMLGDGCVTPFEINPRISTTFCLAAAAGVDPIALYLNGSGGSLAPFQPGVALRRHWLNEIVHPSD